MSSPYEPELGSERAHQAGKQRGAPSGENRARPRATSKPSPPKTDGFGVTAEWTAHAQLLSRRDLSYSIAKTIAETAIESCTANGYRVSAVVVDRAGETMVALRGDNASPHTMENARRKAYTALSFRTSTTTYAKRLADGDPVVREQVTLPNVIAIPGGLPIMEVTAYLSAEM